MTSNGEKVARRRTLTRPNIDGIREEAWRAATSVRERHHTVDALEASVTALAQRIYDVTDWLGAVEARNALLSDVAHKAWHVLDDSGEVPDDDVMLYSSKLQADRLSDALDALEGSGWIGCPQDDDEPDPLAPSGSKGPSHDD